MEEDESKLCENCNKEVPIQNFDMHQAYCLRVHMKCLQCGVLLNRNNANAHTLEYHTPITCPDCQFSCSDKQNLVSHQQDACPERCIMCQFCDLPHPFHRIDTHQKTCGARTDICPQCTKYIKLYDMEKHTTSNCQYPKNNENAQVRDIITITSERLDDIRYQVLHDTQPSESTSNYKDLTHTDTNMTSNYKDLTHTDTDMTSNYKDLTHTDTDMTSNYKDLTHTDTNIISNYQDLTHTDTDIRLPININDDYAPSQTQFRCSHCNQQCSDQETLDLHTAYECLSFRHNEPGNKSSGSTGSNHLENSIPCEFCNHSFDIRDIYFHQQTCRKPQRKIRPTLNNPSLDSPNVNLENIISGSAPRRRKPSLPVHDNPTLKRRIAPPTSTMTTNHTTFSTSKSHLAKIHQKKNSNLVDILLEKNTKKIMNTLHPKVNPQKKVPSHQTPLKTSMEPLELDISGSKVPISQKKRRPPYKKPKKMILIDD